MVRLFFCQTEGSYLWPMSSTISNSGSNKEARYAALFPQLKALWNGENDLIANMANTSAALASTFHFHWVGFYLVKENELVLGPFQGPVACTRIPFGKGVCGTAWLEKRSQVVANVHEFPGHIACSHLSQSEIVIPIFDPKNAGELIAVLDIDSENLNNFDEADQLWLEKIAGEIAQG